MTRTPTFISGCGRSKYATPIRVYEKLATGTTGFSLLRDRICSVRDADLSSMWLVLNSSMNELAEITGQPCKTGCLRKPLIWRGVQRCFIILQLGFLPFGKVSPAAITDSSVAAADWNSFGQSIGPPGAALSAKATPVAEIATRVTESFGRTNGYLSQPRATSTATSAIFYTPLEREAIGRLWRRCAQ